MYTELAIVQVGAAALPAENVNQVQAVKSFTTPVASTLYFYFPTVCLPYWHGGLFAVDNRFCFNGTIDAGSSKYFPMK